MAATDKLRACDQYQYALCCPTHCEWFPYFRRCWQRPPVQAQSIRQTRAIVTTFTDQATQGGTTIRSRRGNGMPARVCKRTATTDRESPSMKHVDNDQTAMPPAAVSINCRSLIPETLAPRHKARVQRSQSLSGIHWSSIPPGVLAIEHLAVGIFSVTPWLPRNLQIARVPRVLLCASHRCYPLIVAMARTHPWKIPHFVVPEPHEPYRPARENRLS